MSNAGQSGGSLLGADVATLPSQSHFGIGQRRGSQHQPRLTPRSKSGCWTCRDRKVKCDEGRPHCANCTRLGKDCDYDSRFKWSDETETLKTKTEVNNQGCPVWDSSARRRNLIYDPGLLSHLSNLAPFALLHSEDDREIKALGSRPGTFTVLATPTSFASLPEYSSLRRSQSLEDEGGWTRYAREGKSLAEDDVSLTEFYPYEITQSREQLLQDPNTFVLKKFEAPMAGNLGQAQARVNRTTAATTLESDPARADTAGAHIEGNALSTIAVSRVRPPEQPVARNRGEIMPQTTSFAAVEPQHEEPFTAIIQPPPVLVPPTQAFQRQVHRQHYSNHRAPMLRMPAAVPITGLHVAPGYMDNATLHQFQDTYQSRTASTDDLSNWPSTPTTLNSQSSFATSDTNSFEQSTMASQSARQGSGANVPFIQPSSTPSNTYYMTWPVASPQQLSSALTFSHFQHDAWQPSLIRITPGSNPIALSLTDPPLNNTQQLIGPPHGGFPGITGDLTAPAEATNDTEDEN